MAKKSLGQHFLSAPGVVDSIIKAGNITAGQTVLEIGPGKGVLTRALLDAGARVVAVEKDDDLSVALRDMFANEIAGGQLVLHHADIMDVDISDICPEQYKVIANIPYNITGILIRHLLTHTHQPTDMVLMVQREVAQRIVAHEGKESMLSVSVKVYGTPRIVRVVKRGSFVPPPKIDSAVIAIENINRNFFADVSEEAFFKIVKNGFREPRKQLKNNLEIQHEKDDIVQACEACDVSPQIRAEDVKLDEWKCLTKAL